MWELCSFSMVSCWISIGFQKCNTGIIIVYHHTDIAKLRVLSSTQNNSDVYLKQPCGRDFSSICWWFYLDIPFSSTNRTARWPHHQTEEFLLKIKQPYNVYHGRISQVYIISSYELNRQIYTMKKTKQSTRYVPLVQYNHKIEWACILFYTYAIIVKQYYSTHY